MSKLPPDLFDKMFGWMAHPAYAPTQPLYLRLVTRPLRYACESCGAPVAAGERFCTRCRP